MKAAKARNAAPGSSGKPVKGRKTKAPVVLPPEARRSTGAALLKHAMGWAGDDLEEVIEIVAKTRAKTRF